MSKEILALGIVTPDENTWYSNGQYENQHFNVFACRNIEAVKTSRESSLQKNFTQQNATRQHNSTTCSNNNNNNNNNNNINIGGEIF